MLTRATLNAQQPRTLQDAARDPFGMSNVESHVSHITVRGQDWTVKWEDDSWTDDGGNQRYVCYVTRVKFGDEWHTAEDVFSSDFIDEMDAALRDLETL